LRGAGAVGGGRGRGRRRGTVEVPPDDGVCLDDGLAAQDDVLCSVDLGAAGDFVAGVLPVGCG
jgi:hypothetical protein